MSSLRSFVAVAAALALVLGAGAATDLESQLEETNDRLDEARDALDGIEVDVDAATADLHDLDQRMVALQADLRDLEAQLAEAQEAYDAAGVEVQAVRGRLQQATVALQAAEQTRDERDRRLDDRLAATYKYGSVSYVSVLLGSEDISDFVSTSYLVRAVIDTDRTMLEGAEQDAREIARTRAEVDGLREQVEARQQAALSALRDVQALTEQQRRVTEQVQSEQARRREILRKLEATQASYEHLVDDLEAESNRLAEELAKSRWRAGAPGAGELVWPTSGRVTSSYGWRTHPIYGTRRMHTGVDIGAPAGQQIVAAAEGLVLSAGWRGGYGLAVVIDHGGGVATLYAHQSALAVAEGEVVSSGQTVGYVGSTGNSTGPHLHFEVRVEGEPRNPMDWY